MTPLMISSVVTVATGALAEAGRVGHSLVLGISQHSDTASLGLIQVCRSQQIMELLRVYNVPNFLMCMLLL